MTEIAYLLFILQAANEKRKATYKAACNEYGSEYRDLFNEYVVAENEYQDVYEKYEECRKRLSKTHQSD